MRLVELAFVEEKCAIGGTLCRAWDYWLWASDAADPTAIDEGRDPLPLPGYPFDPNHCGRPESCTLYAALRARASIGEGEG